MTKNRKEFFTSMALVIVCLTLLTILIQPPRRKQICNHLDVLHQNYYNDSILVSEYQAALDSFMKINPKGAEQFMHLIENENE